MKDHLIFTLTTPDLETPEMASRRQAAFLEVILDRQDAETRAARLYTKARTSLILTQPFFGTLAMRLKPGPDWTIKTAATDGRRIVYNPAWILQHPPRRVMGIIAHEICHVIFKTQARRGNRDPLQWNYATDYAINPLLEDSAQDLDLPETRLSDPDFAALTAEEIYSRIKLPKPPKAPKPAPDPNGTPGPADPDAPKGKGPKPEDLDEDQEGPEDEPGSPPEDEEEEDQDDEPGPDGPRKEIEPPSDDDDLGQVMDDPGPDPNDPDPDDATTWESAALQARDLARRAGKMPAGIDAAITRSIKPTYTLADILREFIMDAAKSDYTWSLPNRLFKAHGIHLPSLRTPEPGTIAALVDVSGSIDARQMKAALESLQGAADELRAPIRLILCNTTILTDRTYEPGEQIQLPTRGNGGTDFRPPFARLAQDPGAQIMAAVYLSADMEGLFPDPADAPPFPVLWISEELGRPLNVPFGRHEPAMKEDPATC